jgi:hypothetical protein
LVYEEVTNLTAAVNITNLNEWIFYMIYTFDMRYGKVSGYLLGYFALQEESAL